MTENGGAPSPMDVPVSAWTDFSGPVVFALDGDTLEVPHKHHPERIRLNDIDYPEKGQAYGQKAKHAVADLAFGKEVTLQTHSYDKYKRTLADCCYPMAPTSITRWSKKAGAGSIGSMRQGIQ